MSTWIHAEAEAASGATSTPVPMATSAITRSIVLPTSSLAATSLDIPGNETRQSATKSEIGI